MKYVGVMTGTSVDGLDIALVDVGDTVAIAAAETVPLPEPLAAALSALASPGADEVVRQASADALLGDAVGNSVLACLKRWQVEPGDVRAIGSHGQTIRHHPRATPAFTVQIGDPSRIAEITGIDTVADFRRRDVAAGGEGAPLVPLFHEALFRHPRRNRAVLNIGGIANVTALPAGRTLPAGRQLPTGEAILGFDTGPGNALLDAWIRRCKGAAFDANGEFAASGKVDEQLLAQLRKDPFLARPPPKSTGKETYHLGFVDAAYHGLEIAAEDVQATLAEFTACSIGAAVARWGGAADEVIVCGGGRRNGDLMRRLAAQLPSCDLSTSDDLGVDGDALEAAAFAWFAHRTLHRQPSNAPSVTGARGARVLGGIYPGGAGPAERASAQ